MVIPRIVLTLQEVPCPNCLGGDASPWAEEAGCTIVRCRRCELLYVNPRPNQGLIDHAVMHGVHADEMGGADVKARRIPSKVDAYTRRLSRMFDWSRPVRWLDIGAGYGEIVEAVSRLAPAGSKVEGLEPMRAKADAAHAMGLSVRNDYFDPSRDKADVISLVDVFSHIPDFRSFVGGIAAALKPGGGLFLVTGNLADLADRSQFPGELGTPDHLVFAGEAQVRQFLERAGFEIVGIERERYDTLANTAKTAIKKLIGRPGVLRLPYTSPYRALFIRATKR